MKTLSHFIDQKIQIVQPSVWRREYELQAEDAVICTLKYRKWFSHDAIVEGFGEKWEIERPSIWSSQLEIKKQHAQLPFAKFIPEKWGKGGTFELPNGERIDYLFNLWKGTNTVFSRQKAQIVSFKRESIWKRTITVVLEKDCEPIDRNPWIIMAVYHQMLMRSQSAHAAT